MRNVTDHVTIAAASLDQGADHVRKTLGVDLAPGGKHPDMSTHNRVAATGRGEFLELIAIDPDAPSVPHPRWFGLDRPDRRARLARLPAPAGWVVRTDNLAEAVARSPVELGRVRKMSRGDRSWSLTVPDSGFSELDGLAPAFIEWDREPHPAESMRKVDLRLAEVILRHPDPVAVRDFLDATGISHLATVDAADVAQLVFRFELPDGRIVTVD